MFKMNEKIEKPKYKIVEVEWFDAQTSFSQPQFIEELADCVPIPTFSVGYLLHEDKEKVILGFMLFSEDMVKHNQLIPKGMIKRIRVLRK